MSLRWKTNLPHIANNFRHINRNLLFLYSIPYSQCAEFNDRSYITPIRGKGDAVSSWEMLVWIIEWIGAEILANDRPFLMVEENYRVFTFPEIYRYGLSCQYCDGFGWGESNVIDRFFEYLYILACTDVYLPKPSMVWLWGDQEVGLVYKFDITGCCGCVLDVVIK